MTQIRNTSGLRAGKGRPKGAKNKRTLEMQQIAMSFLGSPEYQESARARMLAGTAPHLETLWHHYAAGKPTETMQITGAIPPFVLKVTAS